VRRVLGEREAAIDGRLGEQRRDGAGTGKYRCGARAQVGDDLALLVESRAGQAKMTSSRLGAICATNAS